MRWLQRRVGAAEVRATARSWAAAVARSGGPSTREFLAGPAEDVVAHLTAPSTGPAAEVASALASFGRYHGAAGRDADEVQDWLVALHALIGEIDAAAKSEAAAAVRSGWAEGARGRSAS